MSAVSQNAGGPSRRSVLRAGVLGAGALTAGGLVAFPARRALASPEPAAPAGTSLEATMLRGPADGGFHALSQGPGEPYVVRTDLGVQARAGREGRRRAVLAFAQLTDVHLVDAQSPARVEYTDRFDDESPQTGIFSSAYRAHEMLSTQVADSMVRRIAAIGVGPMTGVPLAFTMSTGDNVDNTQRNEVRWFIDILDGTPIRPDSGDLTRWEGVADSNALFYDPNYWHPDGVPAGLSAATVDNYRRLHAFPLVTGLLDAARRPFAPLGVGMPWYAAYGNHDGLTQGNFPHYFPFTELAVGSAKIIGVPGLNRGALQTAAQTGDVSALQGLLSTALVRPVTADAGRAVLTRAQMVAEFFTTHGSPVGHGFTPRNVADGTAYYTIDPPSAGVPVRGIVLDTVNPNGYDDGSLDTTQLAWLEQQLIAVSRRYYDASGTEVRRTGVTDRLVVVFSHHTIDTMTQTSTLIPGVVDPTARVDGATVQALLLRFPNVVLWVNGHTHVNQVVPYRGPHGGFWEVNTASHIDWPEQARLLEIVDNRDGTLSLFGTIIDSAAPLAWDGRIDTTARLASLSRLLGANDPQAPGVTGGTDGRRGRVADRNVELLVAAPFDFDPAAAVPAQTATPSSTGSGLDQASARPAAVGALADTGLDERRAVLALGLTAAAAAAGLTGRRLSRPAPDR